ncbi:MAG: hypothetical protein KUG75_04775 [Pseudomonadales bacterium]|nr:hypothetical protein [Pseudomonadales bacterium]
MPKATGVLKLELELTPMVETLTTCFLSLIPPIAYHQLCVPFAPAQAIHYFLSPNFQDIPENPYLDIFDYAGPLSSVAFGQKPSPTYFET